VIHDFVLFGASGDLASRYLLPALARLQAVGHLPADFRLIGVSREDWDTPAYRHHLHEQTRLDGQASSTAALEVLARRAEHRQIDVRSQDAMQQKLGDLSGPFVAYLALPPPLFAPAIEGLGALPLPEGSRIVVEKPFGEGLASARALNALLHDTVPEEAVYRLDHFLGMQTVQNLLALRFANRIFEPVWNAQHVRRVEIIWDETLTVSGRAGFYDATGALRDMVQNHLLQLLALVAMEPIAALDERSLRDRKVDVLRAVRRLSRPAVARQTVRARYAAGTIDGKAVPAYVDETGVDADRGTETFAQVTLAIDNWRWAGVPFLLRSGKALRRDRREVAVHFKAVPHVAFGDGPPRPNVLRLDLDPDRMSLAVNVKAAGDLFELERVPLQARLASTDLPAYAWLLLDVLRGISTLSIRDDEAEELWRIVEPILEGWQDDAVPLHEYPAGHDVPVSGARQASAFTSGDE
jgi:glucose-6-phosphate 1-dehydrogenase